MQLLSVNTPELEQDFIRVNIELNRTVPGYIRPIDAEIREVFNPARNKAFRQGECTRWVLKDDDGQLIGRIAAFVNKRYKNKGDDVPIGGVGFFDCINNQAAADTLLDVARHWLTQKGMEAMDGPINFGERDKWWGCLIEGFEEPPYGMNYNPPYYQHLLETYGFKPFFYQLCFGLDPKKPLTAKLIQRHAALAADPAFSARMIEKKRLEKYADDFVTIYNGAYAGHGGLKEMKKDQVMSLFRRMKPLMDEKIVWFAYHNDTPIAFFINIPDLNQYFKHFNGRLGLIEKLRLLWMKRNHKCRIFTGVAFGIVPKFQALGIDSFMIYEASLLIQPNDWYDRYEMGWAGDWNPKMINIYKSLGAVQSRRMVTYRYIFDENKSRFAYLRRKR